MGKDLKRLLEQRYETDEKIIEALKMMSDRIQHNLEILVRHNHILEKIIRELKIRGIDTSDLF